MNKADIADVLREIGTILEIKGENPFKSRAYSNAARVLETTPLDLDVLVAENRLSELDGIGSALQEKISTLCTTGSLPYYEELKASLPEGLLEMLRIPGLGPKKVRAVYDKLNITNINDLEAACKDGRVAGLDGFGEKTASNILAGIDQIRSYQNQHRFGDVIGLAEYIIDGLRTLPETTRVSLAGSLRRGKEVIKDIDILVSSSNPAPIMDAFCSMEGVTRVINHGETKSSVLLDNGVQCDLRVVEDSKFPYALHHFTGSKEHNVAMRQLAISKGMKMSEWGLFLHNPDKPDEDGDIIPCNDENDLFQKLDLEFIPPELRENLGEIEAAAERRIPRLLELSNLRGCFHCHTTASDGRSSLEEMAHTADELGFEYFGIADHSKSSFQANGLSEERLMDQVSQIRTYNAAKPSCHLFAGTECDILKDGSLDFSDKTLSQLDYAVASVHNSFTLSEKDMTKRIIRAIENPYITMLGHLTGRILLGREGYQVNVPKIIDAAAETGTWIELNANSYRLDMDWRWWKMARDKGVKCVINPDAHEAESIMDVRFGVQIARKGWLRKKDVINTLGLDDVILSLNEKRSRK